MSSEKELREARMMFRERLSDAARTSMYGRVTGVNEPARTCDVQVGDIIYEGVLLYAVENENLCGQVLIPKKESIVIVARLAGSDRLYVALFSQIEKVIFTLGDEVRMSCDGAQIEVSAPKIVLNGGKLGGLINIEKITEKLNELVDAFNTHTHSIPAGEVAVSGDASAQSNTAPVSVPGPVKQYNAIQSDYYEDKNVTH